MKIKRKVPVFSVIVKRVAESRFPEIQSVNNQPEDTFQFILHPNVSEGPNTDFLWHFMQRLADEFGEPEKIYRFELLQQSRLISAMVYDENLNKIPAVN